MDIVLHPTVSLQEETLNVLVAPPEMLIHAINTNQRIQQYKNLFVSGNFSRILGRLHRTATVLDVRRAFTSFQLMTILEENHHSFLIVEHDPILYEDSGDMVEYVAQRLRQTSREATTLLYSPAMDPHLQKMAELADPGLLLLRGAGEGQDGVWGGEEADHARGVFVKSGWAARSRYWMLYCLAVVCSRS